MSTQMTAELLQDVIDGLWEHHQKTNPKPRFCHDIIIALMMERDKVLRDGDNHVKLT